MRSQGRRHARQERKRTSRVLLFTFHFSLIVLLLGCSHLMHPKADEYLKAAQGADGVDTLLNLTLMMQASIEETRGTAAYESGFHRLHDQFHALHEAMCGVSEAQAAHPDYAMAVTLEEEMRTVFHRLWEVRRDDTLRDPHLDLFAARLQELRITLQAVRSAARPSAATGPA